MKYTRIALLMFLVILVSGCVRTRHTVRRVSVKTAPPVVAQYSVIPDPKTQAFVGTPEVFLPLGDSANWTIGRLYNHKAQPLAFHIPAQWMVLKQRNPALTYGAVRALPDDAWTRWNLVPVPGGPGQHGDWWFRVPVGTKWEIAYDFPSRGQYHRGYLPIISDYTLADHICRGDLVDFAGEVGGAFCR